MITAAELKRMGKRAVNGVAVPIDTVEGIPLGPQSPLRARQAASAPTENGPRYKSKGEALYAGYLHVRQRGGDILDWRYESVTLRLGERVRYTSDFYVRPRTGRIQLHEVKGPWAWEDSRVKLQAAAAAYPDLEFYLVKVIRGKVESITRIRALTEVVE